MLETNQNKIMAEICKNCEYEIALNFCANCGQKKTKRIDRNYIKDEIQYTVLHMNKGFLYSIKKILRAPGKTAREFVEGNRVNHYKPILLVFVVASISAFLTNTLIHPEEIIVKYYVQIGYSAGFAKSFASFFLKYQAFIMLFSIPFMAFFTWLVFKKWGYNYYENIVITAYSLVCMQVLTILIVLPLQYFFKNDPNLFFIIPTSISYLIMFGIFPWFYIDLYNNKSAGEVILRLFLLAFSLIVAFLILFVIIGVGAGIYMASNGIDPATIFNVKQ